ncbi:V4R domain-containing protein [Cupriavidus taiwanensis]|uniref:V4R domain-containing protein n=1 Tax=Cupriavidus taiwanensis TaxID=164546 RepID=UPI000E1096FE|nr:V4R domain-containing protein [Cupriavidus taiwanensis]SPA47831.1 conserved protein of unknown function [Cupriavidus taiwanensis]
MTTVAARLETPLAQRLQFDAQRGEVRDQDRRYLLMRPDVLMGTLRLLDDATRACVLAAFAESAAVHGRRSILAYVAGLGPDAGEALLDLIRRTSPALGWGCWDLARRGNGLVLAVANSPFAAGYGPAAQPVCAPIAGMFRTIAETVLACPVQVEETACAAMGGHDTCRFVARPAAQGVSP